MWKQNCIRIGYNTKMCIYVIKFYLQHDTVFHTVFSCLEKCHWNARQCFPLALALRSNVIRILHQLLSFMRNTALPHMAHRFFPDFPASQTCAITLPLPPPRRHSFPSSSFSNPVCSVQHNLGIYNRVQLLCYWAACNHMSVCFCSASFPPQNLCHQMMTA